ncbi:hypothetical protein HU200_008622 [Digitaria exilis]|uniref:C2H2-type domain-containing protein n=1 Tax=Digitaria exilis TaxID=1010633 RepID=A0A835FKN1_9POAL|nr:hypothetical protein HU200_008622 [Digitaria exilis]
MAKTTCKLCFRRFPSPRALAGHMRSHSIAVTQAAAAAAAAVKQQISSASSASTSIATAYEDLASKVPAASAFGLPKRGADASFSDRESEAESTPPHAKRVKAVAAAAAAWGEAEPVSSLSEQVVTPEEDVAMSLMMLSRDSWPSAALGDDDYDGYSDEGSDDGYAPPAPPLTPAVAPVTARRPPALVEKRTQFPCVACKKVFRSYQALGGHRASNVRGGRGGCLAPPVAPHPPPPPPQQPAEPEASPQQASTAAAAASTSTTAAAATDPSPINNNAGMIDLNVAPPSEEVEVSAVSDPRFNP